MLTTNYFFLLTLTLCLGLFCLRGSRRCVQFNDTCLVVCMCVSVWGHAPCVDALRASEARSVGSLELELHEVLSHWIRCTELHSDSAEERRVLLSTEPSLQPLSRWTLNSIFSPVALVMF